MYPKTSLFLFLFFCGARLFAQQLIQIRVADSLAKKNIPSVTIAENKKVLAITDSIGEAAISLLPGSHVLLFTSVGYWEKTVIISVPVSGIVEVMLLSRPEGLEEAVVVASTRNNQPIESAPLKVEILGREEMDEENNIKPGNIASILGDVSGIQIQQSSVASGNSNVRIQGLEGRYTQILRDGMPLYDGFSGGFGILSIPPLDLKQVELIKGSASTLYGGGAIGGLINIISRKPNLTQNAVVTINQTTLKETNVNTFLSKRNGKSGYTFFAGYNRQIEVDVNKDGFSDLPRLRSFVAHPRLFIYPGAKTSIVAGYTITAETRKGGDMLVLQNKAGNQHQYYEENKLQRHTGELMVEHHTGNNLKLEFKSSISSFNRAIRSANYFFKANQQNYFSELAVLKPGKKNNWVIGLNYYADRLKKLPSDPVLFSNFSNNTIGIFAQYTITLKEKTTFEAGLRDDYQNQYGNFFLPRFSFFHRFNDRWGMRAGWGAGYKVPNVLTQQVSDFEVKNILPLPPGIKAEKSSGYNAELNYKIKWDENNEAFINHAFFLTRIIDPVVITEQPNGQVSFSNASRPIVTKGFDTYIRLTLHDWEFYIGHTYTIAERKYLQQNKFIPYTPKIRMAFTLVKEWDEKWRVGLEGSYNGYQRRNDYSKTPGYFFLAAMMQYNVNRYITIVLNGENLFDYRQSRVEQLFTGTMSNPVFKTLWAPIDGRVINLSVKLHLSQSLHT
jgi:iron complex outermembrane receptor protein/outer membrane receptor for ferrienterochelin and colicins